MNPVEALAGIIIEASGGNHVKAAFYTSLIAALLTSLGSLGVLFVKRPRDIESNSALLDVGMGFSSGVMTVASFTSLLLPAIDMAGPWPAMAGFVLGAATIYVLNSIVPHEHFVKGYEGPTWGARKLMSAWLVAIAIIIHNLPEGLSIGAVTVYDVVKGTVLGVAIGIQDVPEGLSVALPIAIATGSKRLAVLVGVLSGFSEVVAAILASLVGSASSVLLPYTLGFGAGAMMYVVSHEALPESHRTGHEGKATLGFFLGFLIMLYLDTVLG